MKKLLVAATALSLLGMMPMVANASPESDLKAFRGFFFKRFPGVKLQDFADGIYGIDAKRKEEWTAMEEFPPYEPGIDIGKKLFAKYKVGSCFKNGGIAIKQNYPYFNSKDGTVHSLEGDVLTCLEKNGVDLKAEKITTQKGKLAAITAYMAFTSRGKKINVVVPKDKRALAAYNLGKQHFYAKRGQLNFSCADCHAYNSGRMARANLLSPALGHVSHFPVYRKQWEAGGTDALAGFGTIERRYGGCNKSIRAKPLNEGDEWKFKQHPEYVALEYFESYMSNGIAINGPGIRE